jgi:AAA family ATP:ADP antiporter
VGASVGGIAGSAVSAFLAETVGIFALLLIACVPLEIASWCAGWLHRNDRGRRRARTDLDLPLPGTAFSGMRVVFRSPYLMAIAGYLALMTFASTVLYFQQAFLVGEAIADRAARASFFAQIDLAVNILTIVLQVAVTARILRWLGVGFSLMIVPALTMLGFVGLGLAPLLAVLVVLQVLYRAGRYGIAKPVREVLFTVVSREERYKSKAFLDAAVYRGGDLVSGWIYAGLAAVGLSVGAIALVAAPLAALWVLMSLSLGRRHERLVAAEPGGA